MFQKKIVKKAKRLVFTCFFKGLQMVELKKKTRKMAFFQQTTL